MSNYIIDQNKSSNNLDSIQINKNYIKSPNQIDQNINLFLIDEDAVILSLQDQWQNQYQKSNLLLNNTSKVNYNNLNISAYRNNLYNPLYNKFVQGFPITSIEYYNEQNISSSFINGSKFLGKKNQNFTYDITQQNYSQFNIDRSVFSSNSIVDSYKNPNYDNVYTINGLTFFNEITINYLIPSYESESSDYNDVSFSVQFDELKINPSDLQSETEYLNLYNLNVILNEEVVVNIIYSNNYINNYLTVSHPVFNKYKRFKTLSILLTPETENIIL